MVKSKPDSRFLILISVRIYVCTALLPNQFPIYATNKFKKFLK